METMIFLVLIVKAYGKICLHNLAIDSIKPFEIYALMFPLEFYLLMRMYLKSIWNTLLICNSWFSYFVEIKKANYIYCCLLYIPASLSLHQVNQ